MVQKEFSFGSKPRMKEVPAGTEAVFSFNKNTEPVIIETEKYGEKYSFSINLISHPSYPLLDGTEFKGGETQTMTMDWESKAQCAKQLYDDYHQNKLISDNAYHKALLKAYAEEKWRLTRFDSGEYWLDCYRRKD